MQYKLTAKAARNADLKRRDAGLKRRDADLKHRDASECEFYIRVLTSAPPSFNIQMCDYDRGVQAPCLPSVSAVGVPVPRYECNAYQDTSMGILRNQMLRQQIASASNSKNVPIKSAASAARDGLALGADAMSPRERICRYGGGHAPPDALLYDPRPFVDTKTCPAKRLVVPSVVTSFGRTEIIDPQRGLGIGGGRDSINYYYVMNRPGFRR